MNDDLEDRLDAVESDLADTSPDTPRLMIVYTDGDGYVTPDGDPVPTNDDGDPVAPDGPGPLIILKREHVTRDGDATDTVEDAADTDR